MKKNYLLLPVIFTLILAGCQGAPSYDAEADERSAYRTDGAAQITAAQSDMWRVELHSAETAQSLSATIAAVQYGGGVLETKSEVVAGRGNVFLLLGLTIEKIGEGRGSFSWNDAHVTDSDGNMYHRHPNDTFLAHLSIPRMRGTDIVFGNETGYVCFEIPIGAEGLSFVADEGSIIIDVPIAGQTLRTCIQYRSTSSRRSVFRHSLSSTPSVPLTGTRRRLLLDWRKTASPS